MNQQLIKKHFGGADGKSEDYLSDFLNEHLVA